MSTIGYKSWAVDLANVETIYPFQGWEIPMTILCVIFWLGWHIIQIINESKELKKAQTLCNKKTISDSLDRY